MPDYGKYVNRLPPDTKPELARALADVFRDLTEDKKPAETKVGLYKHVESDYGAKGDGVNDDTAAFVAAAASGRKVELRDGATYLLSAGMSMSTGSGFICRAGYANILLKTGSGGFNITNLGGTRTDLDRCVFSCVSVDDIDLVGLRIYPDGANERVIYPIRTSGGMGTKGIRIERIVMTSFYANPLISLNTVGAGSYVVRDVTAYSCGTALTTWTGTPQITVVEIDNDMVSSTPSEPGFIYNVRGIDLELTGSALSTYGQQTDVLNVAGISGTDKKGPTAVGIYGENVGEVLDVFGGFGVYKGIRIRDAYNYGVKLIHGARHNHIEIESIDNFGQAAVGIFGSSSISVDTAYNTVVIDNVVQENTIGSFSDVAAVLFGDNGGVEATCLPRSNTVVVRSVLGDGVDLDYVVRDGGSDNDNNNFVEITRASGWATRFCDCPPDNVRVRMRNGTDVRLTMSGAQSITTATPVVVDFDTVARDVNAEADTANNRVRCATPGRKLVNASVRIAGIGTASADISLRIRKNGTTVRQLLQEAVSTAFDPSFELNVVVYIGEDEAGTSSADIDVQIEVVSASGTLTVSSNSDLSYLEVVDLT